MQKLPRTGEPGETPQRSILPNELEAFTDLDPYARSGRWIGHVVASDDPTEHDRRHKKRDRIERDRERRRQRVDETAGKTGTDQCRRSLAKRDFGVRLHQ